MVPDEARRLQMLRLVRDELSADLEDSDLDGSLNASGHSLMRSRPKSGQVSHLLLLLVIASLDTCLRDSLDAVFFDVMRCLSRLLDVTFVYCVETAKETAVIGNANRILYQSYRMVSFSMTMSYL